MRQISPAKNETIPPGNASEHANYNGQAGSAKCTYLFCAYTFIYAVGLWRSGSWAHLFNTPYEFFRVPLINHLCLHLVSKLL